MADAGPYPGYTKQCYDFPEATRVAPTMRAAASSLEEDYRGTVIYDAHFVPHAEGIRFEFYTKDERP
jgi:predicted nucleic acid-binding protein